MIAAHFQFKKCEGSTSAETELLARIASLQGFHSQESFNDACRRIIRLWDESSGGPPLPPDQFPALLQRVEAKAQGAIPTSWGGVLVTSYVHPNVEKFLLVRKGHYLAFEKHEEKIETLSVREGCGLLLYRRKGESLIAIAIIRPGYTITLYPGEEHCIVGAENLVVFEQSTDPKGMDNDLVFIFLPD